MRLLQIAVIFFLGAASAIFVNFTKPPVTKPVEVTREAVATESAVISRVIDGDTVELSDGRKLRYIGIDTPEIVAPGKPIECFGREAKAENEKLVLGKTVHFEKDVSETDKYQRLLRYVYVGDIFVNDYLVRQGFAHASTYPPDVKFSEKLRQAEQEARAHKRGLWLGCSAQ